MINDQVRDDLEVIAQCPHVIPVAQAGIDFCVVLRVEARVGSINRIEEWEQVNATKKVRKGSLQRRFQLFKISRESIGVSNELNLIFQVCLNGVYEVGHPELQHCIARRDGQACPSVVAGTTCSSRLLG